jgi:hypothetical protein
MEYRSVEEMESELNDLLERVEDETGLDTGVFDEVEVTDDLPSNVPAATKHQKMPYEKVKLYTDPSLLKRPWADKGLTLTHEAVHGNQMKYQLNSNISDTLNEDQRKFFQKKQNQSLDQLEAGTELLARALFPQNSYAEQKGYPYLTKKARDEADQKGLDLEAMLEEDSMEEFEEVYQNSAYELANDISEYMESVEEFSTYSEPSAEESDDLEYLLDNEDFYDVTYANGANQPGNEKDSRVPIEASIDYGNRNNAAV